ncbi:hypothetical protein [Xanthomonas sp. WHRI 8932A]|uniref:hypothetical protein n=1 Tax=unclassified Xanthomonas TaxID=2643310 RepID=UPI002B23B409|nr:hypothetical protein [Xanthomonas sp. WHRI 8932A]MEA9566658.1 hypothetical protein [Xanthomonas sp. WHRI 8932A]
MAIETWMPPPASSPVKPRAEPREELPAKDAATFERWLSPERSPGTATVATTEQAVQAGTLSAAQAARDVDQALALDSIVFEWTATATYLMSYVDHRRSGLDIPVHDSAAIDGNALAQPRAVSSAGAIDLQSTISSSLGVSGLYASATDLPVISKSHADTDGTQPLRASPTASLGAWAEWMSRSIKQISDAEGRSTVWIRDYQISDAQLPALLDALLQSGQGRPDRIMLNGALIWQRASNTQGVSSGD